MQVKPNDSLNMLEEHLRGCSISLKPSVKPFGPETWFPYYAGYSSEFVRETLLGLGVKKGMSILDPWNGAGTTTSVADQIGCHAIGFDINPVAALVASARLTRCADMVHSSGLAGELLEVATRQEALLDANDPLLAWLSPRISRRYRSIQFAILSLLGARSGVLVDLQSETPPPFAAFFLLCLIRAAKGITCLKKNSNPTWMTPEKRGDARATTFDRAFLRMVEAHANNAEQEVIGASELRAIGSVVSLADARQLPVPDHSVDAVVTSPPYCTRVDYFRATLFELAALGIGQGGERYKNLRCSAMGTNLTRVSAVTNLEFQPQKVQDLLHRIKAHPSKASNSYYYKIFAHYFEDSRLSLGEIKRVLKPNSTAVIVVQSSYYKNISIPLGELFAAMGEELGFKSRVVLSVPVRRVLASIHPRAKFYLADRQYTEDVVALNRIS